MDRHRRELVDRLLAEGRAHDAQQSHRDEKYRNLDRESAELLHLLVRALAPSRVLEVGTSNGTSTIWIADALPVQATMASVDNDPRRHGEAVSNLAAAGLDERVSLILGDAAEVLRAAGDDSLDLVFLDADRVAYVGYWPDLRRAVRAGGVVVVDNCLSHADEVADFRQLVDGTDGVESVLVPLGAGLLLITL